MSFAVAPVATPQRARAFTLAVSGAALAAVAAGAVALAHGAARDQTTTLAAVTLLAACSFIASGLVALRRRPDAWTGALMIVAGFALFGGSLASAGSNPDHRWGYDRATARHVAGRAGLDPSVGHHLVRRARRDRARARGLPARSVPGEARSHRSQRSDRRAQLDARAREARGALARALRDPSLEVAYWVPESKVYVSIDGRRVEPSGPAAEP